MFPGETSEVGSTPSQDSSIRVPEISGAHPRSDARPLRAAAASCLRLGVDGGEPFNLVYRDPFVLVDPNLRFLVLVVDAGDGPFGLSERYDLNLPPSSERRQQGVLDACGRVGR